MRKQPRLLNCFLAVLMVLAIAGCTSFGGESAVEYKSLSANQTRLIFSEPTLVEATTSFRVTERTPSGNRIERGRWDGLFGDRAELMLTDSKSAKGINSPEDPRDLVDDFRGLIRLNAAFGDLYQSNTSMGVAVWRRFVAGDRSCLIFSQRWDSGPDTPVSRILAGYYCAKPGGTYTIQDAQSTLLTIGIKPQ